MKKCDVVMKGGITSGIVYPGAVCELANEYEFVNIGGTSAGAIAAALTAAAEYRRRTTGSRAGFDAIAALPAWLGEAIGGRPRLLRLFQPSDDTKALHEIAIAAVEAAAGGWQKRLRAVAPLLLRRFTRLSGAVAAAGALVAVLIAAPAGVLWSAGHAFAALALLVALGALIGAVAVAYVLAACLEAAATAARALPRNGFGICSGAGGDDAGPALTPWLADEIDRIAGRDRTMPPLTFGDLWMAGDGSGGERAINLEMMTTNLTHGRPYRLPAKSRRFFFTREEMRVLFPERIVDWMVAHSRTTTHPPRRPYMSDRGEPLYAMPRPFDLPVVVATRMSLSFPILLSAVPLHAIDYGVRTRQRKPERCWFSDGGITSNFPVHFFDAPLPRWPTFAFNLAEKTPRYHATDQRIYLPQTNAGGILEWWSAIDDLPQFLWSIVSTMQNWRDNMLLRMPGHRDRIAHVLLDPREGGLNLTMDAATIRDVSRRGSEAARLLRERFGPDPRADAKLTWRNHKWVRFRSFMFALEGALASGARAFDDDSEPPSYRELLDGEQPSYVVRQGQLRAMRLAAAALFDHVREDFAGAPFRTPRQRPKPAPVLRAMPQE